MSGRYGMANPYVGSIGTAERLVIPNTPRAIASLDCWLLTTQRMVLPSTRESLDFAERLQFFLSCVQLRDDPATRAAGYKAPFLKFPDATHEVQVTVVDPDGGPYTKADFEGRLVRDELLPLLRIDGRELVKVAEQFVATDEEMSELLQLMAIAVVDDHLPAMGKVAELSGIWLTAGTRTLAHIRGEHE